MQGRIELGEKIESYRDLVVYQKAYKLVLEIYEITNAFPKEEIYGLVSQLRRAGVSIPSNITKGYRRGQERNIFNF